MEIPLSEEQKKCITEPESLYPIMREILLRDNKIDINKEHFWAIGLAPSLLLQYVELISLGGTKRAIVEPMNVFRLAVMKGSTQIIFVHNHPSGILLPSLEDEHITDRLFQVGRILDVKVTDHLIISPESFYSFGNSGLLEKISQSLTWVPTYELEERIKKEKAQIVKEMLKQGEAIGLEKGLKKGMREGKKEKAFEMAKAMLNDNKPIAEIRKYTGLTKKEIEGIELGE